jgi:hypothetical protein
MNGGCTRAERRRADRQMRMAEGLGRRRSDPLAVKFGRVMSDPAMRERCLALNVGESATANITERFKVVVTRLEGGELEIAVLT